jgi:hypothetical protein
VTLTRREDVDAEIRIVLNALHGDLKLVLILIWSLIK